MPTIMIMTVRCEQCQTVHELPKGQTKTCVCGNSLAHTGSTISHRLTTTARTRA